MALRCPICGAAVDPQSTLAMPFCSTRCRRIDTDRWLSEAYSVPVDLEREETEDGEEQPGDGAPPKSSR